MDTVKLTQFNTGGIISDKDWLNQRLILDNMGGKLATGHGPQTVSVNFASSRAPTLLISWSPAVTSWIN
jgi:hypothetical protein